MNISLNATGALIYLGNGKVVVHRPSIITCSVEGSTMHTMKRRTGSVVNHAPNSVITIHPLGGNIVTGFSIATTVLGEFIGVTLGNSFFGHMEVIMYVPSNMARIRDHTI